jgi:4-hydroxybenzoate polyprenyltransferase
LALAATLVGYHFRLIRGRTREGCFKAFRHSGWVGAAVLGGIIASYSLR